MTKKVTPYEIYLAIRPGARESKRAYETLNSILNKYPSADASLAGVGHDATRVIFSVGFSVPVSNTDPSAIAAIKCINDVFESMFDYMPYYCAEPTYVEADAAMSLLTSKDNMIDFELSHNLSKNTTITNEVGV